MHVTIYGHNAAIIGACHVYIENLCEHVYEVLFKNNTGALYDMLIRTFLNAIALKCRIFDSRGVSKIR